MHSKGNHNMPLPGWQDTRLGLDTLKVATIHNNFTDIQVRIIKMQHIQTSAVDTDRPAWHNIIMVLSTVGLQRAKNTISPVVCHKTQPVRYPVLAKWGKAQQT